MRGGSCAIPRSRASKLEEEYVALHEGRESNGTVCEVWSPPRGAVIGRATEIQYLKEIPEGEPSFYHPWAEEAQPSLGIDEHTGLPFFYTGRYEVTRRGIEDRLSPGMTSDNNSEEYLKIKHIQPERLPKRPRELITLGTLEWIRYENGEKSDKLTFNPEDAPVVCRDQNGNLHIVSGRDVLSEQGAEHTMKRSHRRRRHHNPSMAMVHHGHGAETGSQRAMRMILDSVIVGGVATLAAVGMNMALGYAPTWSPLTKALTKVGVGLGAGLGLAYLLPSVPQVAAGVSVGGVVDGFLDLWNMYIAPRLVSTSTTTTTTTTQTTPTGTTPAGYAYLPSGARIPSQYAGFSPAACGVR